MRNPSVSRITHHELARRLEASTPEPDHRDEGWALVDVRTPQAWARMCIPGALQISTTRIGTTLGRRFAPEKVIVVYGESEAAGEDAAERLSALGFRRVQCLVGGIASWAAAALPLEGGVRRSRTDRGAERRSWGM